MLIVLLNISLRMIIVIPKGTRSFGELKIFLQIMLLSIPLPTSFLMSSKGMTLGNSIFMNAVRFCKVFYLS